MVTGASASPIGSVLMVSPSADMGDGPVDPDHPIRLGPSPCPSASGYPSGTPVRGPPARGPARGPRGEISGPGAPRPGGRPGRPPGAQNGPPARGPEWGPYGAFYTIFPYLTGGSRGVPPWVHFWAPGPRGARGAKKCTFFWVFNNSPSRDSFGPLFWPPGTGPFSGYPGGNGWGCRLGQSLWDHIPHHAQHALLGTGALGSMAATGPARASSARVGGT